MYYRSNKCAGHRQAKHRPDAQQRKDLRSDSRNAYHINWTDFIPRKIREKNQPPGKR